MEYTSRLELSKSALAKNFEYIYNLAGTQCAVSHVVKGNAYGHGIESYVPLAVSLGAKHFSTFDAHEAYRVCKVVGKNIPIVIMGMLLNEQLPWVIENDIEFFVFEEDRLHAAIREARRQKKKARVHIELETGMNRTGFEQNKFKALTSILKENSRQLELKGLCTHYAGAESVANFMRVERQYQNFMEGVEQFSAAHLHPEKKHTACSAACIRLPKTRMDMVRIGILQYGFWPSKETFITSVPGTAAVPNDPLKRVLSWKSRVMNIKQIKRGEYVGYGNSFLAETAMTVAAVPVGYAYGFSRSLSNQGRALVRGKRVSVIGTVNMNVMMLDITHVEGVEKGDEVVLIGTQGDMEISVSSFSEFSEQLNYELLTRIPESIERKIVD